MTDDILNDTALRILQGLDEGVYGTDRARNITFWNKGAERITGFSAEEVVGKNCADNILNHIDGEGNLLCGAHCPLSSVMKTGKEETVYLFLHHKDGHRIPVKIKALPFFGTDGRVINVVEIFSDTSEVHLARRKIDLLQKELYSDPLTGIGNRRFCDMELNTRLEELNNHGTPFAAALCDIDDFKKVNDTYGHDMGDRVLEMMARTLSETLRALDAVGRWGGEEFLLILPLTEEKQDLFDMAERSRLLIRESYLYLGDVKISVTASFGVSSARKGDTVETFFKRIDELLYRSKREGKNRVTVG